LAKTATVGNANFPQPRIIPNKGKSVNIDKVVFPVQCPKCGKIHKIFGYFDVPSETIKRLQLPVDNKIQDNDILMCDSIGCNFAIDLKPSKNQIETHSKRKVTFK